MRERRIHEKEEKAEEKRHEKGDEKNWDEKWRDDPINIGTWGIILIWAGVGTLLGNAGAFGTWQTWAVVLTGVGAAFILAALVRLSSPRYRQPVLGNLILGVILIGVGLGDLVRWSIIGPLIPIVIGIAIFYRGFVARR